MSLVNIYYANICFVLRISLTQIKLSQNTFYKILKKRFPLTLFTIQTANPLLQSTISKPSFQFTKHSHASPSSVKPNPFCFLKSRLTNVKLLKSRSNLNKTLLISTQNWDSQNHCLLFTNKSSLYPDPLISYFFTTRVVNFFMPLSLSFFF